MLAAARTPDRRLEEDGREPGVDVDGAFRRIVDGGDHAVELVLGRVDCTPAAEVSEIEYDVPRTLRDIARIGEDAFQVPTVADVGIGEDYKDAERTRCAFHA